MHIKSSKWVLGFVHYITILTISRFVTSRLECITVVTALMEKTAKVNLILRQVPFLKGVQKVTI